MKKYISLLLALAMLLGCGTAFASEANDEITDRLHDGLEANDQLLGLPVPELPIVDEEMKLTVMYPRQVNHGDFTHMWFIDEVAKLTNVRMVIEPVEASGFNEKINLCFAGDDYSQLYLSGISVQNANVFGQAGMLYPMEDMIAQYAPNVQTVLDTMPNMRKNLTAEDGHIYGVGSVEFIARDMVVKEGYINYAWLDRLGLKKPTTVDELYDVLVAIRDNDANGNGDPSDEIPLSYVYGIGGSNAGTTILYAFGFVNGLHDVIDDQYVFVPMQENFREYVKYMNKLYADGLVDPEIFTMTGAQYNAKMADYKVFFTTPEMMSVLPNEEQQIEYKLIGPMTSPVNDKLTWRAQLSDGIGFLMNITDKCTEEEAIAAIKLLDFFYSEKGTFMIKCGPEEGTWDGEGGWSVVENEDGTKSYKINYVPEKYPSFYDFRIANGLMNMPFCYTSEHAALVLGTNAWHESLTESVFESGAYANRRMGWPPAIAFTEDEQDILAPYVLLEQYVNQTVARFIAGELDPNDDAAWDEFLQTIESMDVQTMIDVRQAAYDRWNNA